MSQPRPSTGYVRNWLAGVPWESVEALNQALCAGGHAAHGRTTDGYEKTKSFWEEARAKGELHYADIVELCEKAHRAAPFLNFNGNTFVAIVRQFAHELPLGETGKAGVRQAAGHIVAGVLPPDQSEAFLIRLRKR